MTPPCINSKTPKLSLYRNHSIDLQSKSVGWFLYDDNFDVILHLQILPKAELSCNESSESMCEGLIPFNFFHLETAATIMHTYWCFFYQLHIPTPSVCLILPLPYNNYSTHPLFPSLLSTNLILQIWMCIEVKKRGNVCKANIVRDAPIFFI